MLPASFGDLARTMTLRSSNARLNADLTRLGAELTTGRKRDYATAAAGDVGPVASITRQIRALDSFHAVAGEAELFFDMAQETLSRVQERSVTLRDTLLLVQSGSASSVDMAAQDARSTFVSSISALNVSVGGRTLFGGIATGGAALQDGAAMLADIAALAAGAPDAAAASAAVDAYFAPGGGFEATGYLGSTTSLQPFPVAPNETVPASLRADDDTVRAMLSAQAKAAILSEGIFAGVPSERKALVEKAASDIGGALDGFLRTRARIGAVQGRIEGAQARIGSERTALQMARQDLIGVDAFEAASELEQTRTQLETLYSITGRLQRLSLTNYL